MPDTSELTSSPGSGQSDNGISGCKSPRSPIVAVGGWGDEKMYFL